MKALAFATTAMVLVLVGCGCGDDTKRAEASRQPPAKDRLALAITKIEVRKTASPDGPPLKTLAPSGAASLRLVELAADERTPDLTCSLRLDVKTADGELLVLYANPKYGHFDGPIEFRGRRWVVENQAELLGLVGQSHGKVPAK
jgi:hypothetical protein